MFDGFFEKNPPINSEQTDKESTDRIKAAVLKSISQNPDTADNEICGESEVTPMKKRSIARPFIIAAAVASLGAMSLVSAHSAADKLPIECRNDNIYDEKKEFFEVRAFDENGKEIVIGRDIMEWTKNADGTFDIMWDVSHEEMEEIKGSVSGYIPEEFKTPDNFSTMKAADKWEKVDIKESNISEDSADKEFFEVRAFDENGEEILIGRDIMEWVKNEDGTFDIMWDVSPEEMEEIRSSVSGYIPEEFKNPDISSAVKSVGEWEKIAV